MLSSLLSYWARTTCHVTYSVWASYLQPALRSGTYDYCRGRRSVSQSLRRTRVPSGSPGYGRLGRRSRGRRPRVDAHDSSDPGHVAAAVPWYLYGSDGHGAARVEDMADHARNGPLPESDRVCVICFGDLEQIAVTREAASVGNGSYVFRTRELIGDRCARNGNLSSAVLKSVYHLCEFKLVWTVSRSLRAPRHTRQGAV